MPVDRDVAAREAAPVDDRRVVELVAADEHPGPGERADDAEVRGETGGEERGPRRPLPLCKLVFELGVNRAGADNEASRSGPCAPTVECLVRGRDHRRMGGEAEVVVRGERHDRAVGRSVSAVAELPLWTLGVDGTGFAPPTRGADRVALALGPRVPGHRPASSPISSSASLNACTIRWSSSDVIVRGGMSVTLSPMERSRTPRSTAAALDAAAPPQAVGGRRELDRAHEAAQADVFDRGLGRDAIVEQAGQLVGTLAHVGQHIPRLDQLEVAERYGRGQRVPAEGMTVVERLPAQIVTEESFEHRAARRGHRHGEVARGEALAQTEQVGAKAALLRREEGAGPAEAGRDLIADQEHVVGAARRSEAREPTVIRHLHSGRGLHGGLDDDGRELGAVLGDQAHGGVETLRVVERGRAYDRESQRVEDIGAESVVADGKRADRVAVVRPAEREERGASSYAPVVPVLERDLERLLHRRRAVAGIQEMWVVDGNDAGQRFGELDDYTVAVAEHGRVCAERELVQDRVVELGNVMTQGRDPQRRDRVEVVPTVDVDQLPALGPVDDDRVVVGEGRHLGEAVPHDLRVPPDPITLNIAALDVATPRFARLDFAVVRGHPAILTHNVPA